MVGEKRIRWYEQMLEIRLFEEKVQELFMEGLVEGTTHLCQGQEAVPVGAVSAMREDDYMTITYRGHGHALARGIPMEACFAEMMGRTTGCCKGVGGSMHLTTSRRAYSGPSRSSVPAYRWPWAPPFRAPPGPGQRCIDVLRGRRDEHRDVSRGAEPGQRLEGADDLHHREQPLRRIHANARDDAARRSRRPRQGLRHSRHRRGWTGRRGGS